MIRLIRPIERRFSKSLKNLLAAFRDHADHTMCFLNHQSSLQLIFEQEKESRQIYDQHYFKMLTEISKS